MSDKQWPFISRAGVADPRDFKTRDDGNVLYKIGEVTPQPYPKLETSIFSLLDYGKEKKCTCGAEKEMIHQTFNSLTSSIIRLQKDGKNICEIQAISFHVCREKAPLYTMGQPRQFKRHKSSAGTILHKTETDISTIHEQIDRIEIVVYDEYGKGKMLHIDNVAFLNEERTQFVGSNASEWKSLEKELKCECGAEKCNTTHADWCDLYQPV